MGEQGGLQPINKLHGKNFVAGTANAMTAILQICDLRTAKCLVPSKNKTHLDLEDGMFQTTTLKYNTEY
jgi:hypothetical protein